MGALYFFTGFGHQAVMVFFVLSGFLISSTILRSHILGAWSWREYAVNRATRLYVVLIPGLLLGFLWDRLGSWRFAPDGLYSHAIRDLGPAVPLENLTPGAFFGNLLFLQTIRFPTFGSNGPLWSLANEFWYYVLFPAAFGAALAWAGRRVGAAIVLTGVALGVCAFIGWSMLIGFLIWLAGFGLVLLYSRIQMRSRRAVFVFVLISAFLLCATLFTSRKIWENSLLSDLGVGLAFAVFLFAALQSAMGEESRRYSAVAHEFAGFSYSLYVLHFPFLLFLRAWFVPQQRWQPTALHLPGRSRGWNMLVVCLACLAVYREKNERCKKVGQAPVGLTPVSGLHFEIPPKSRRSWRFLEKSVPLFRRVNPGQCGVAVQQLQGDLFRMVLAHRNISLPVGISPIGRSPEIVAILFQSGNEESSFGVRMHGARLKPAGSLASHAGPGHWFSVSAKHRSSNRRAGFLHRLRMDQVSGEQGRAGR